MADQFVDESEQTVSIQEYLEEVEEQELEADLVLGGDEGKECTYVTGYMKRQAVFSCLTCTPDGNAGVCTACSLACHDGHEIVELWTKRNFRCDCGNSKFGEFFCRLMPSKDVDNKENLYNHNFKGLYCTCGQPYPDPNVDEQVEMMQCCICEDWFHEEHLGLECDDDEIPRDELGEPLYDDFICEACSPVFSFLTFYPQTIWATVKQPNQEVVNLKGKDVVEDEPLSAKNQAVNGMDSTDAACVKHVTVNSDSGASSSGACVIGVDLDSTSPKIEKSKPLFLSKNWRDALCRCEKCQEFYSRKNIAYLLEKGDSIAEYEKVAKEKRAEKLQQQEGNELNLLNKLGHVEKMEILSGIADMKNEFLSFMNTFDSSKPITTADIHQVFENLAKKRRRSD